MPSCFAHQCLVMGGNNNGCPPDMHGSEKIENRFGRLVIQTPGGFIRKNYFGVADNRPGHGNPLLLVVDHLEKPGNLGAIFRSADGAGATGVIVSDPSAEISNPNVIRASLGTVFTVPKAVAPAPDAISWLKANGIAIAATTPDAETSWSEVDLASPSAIVLGSQDRGLGDEWLKAADIHVRIPMRGVADSLNVSAAAAILLYEALRQRLQSG